MNRSEKSDDQNLQEIAILRRRLEELEKIEEEHRRSESALRDSEARYKKLIGAISDYVYTVELDAARVVRTSHGPGCEGVTGYRPEEFERDPYLWFNMIHEQDREAVTRQADAVWENRVAPIEHRIIHKDGSVRWVRNTPVQRFGTTGEMKSYDGLIVDITEKKCAEDALARQTERLSVTLDSINDGVVTLDRDGRVVLLNPVAEIMTGWSRQEASGRPVQEVVRLEKPEGEPCEPLYACVVSHGKALERPQEVVLVNRNGERRIISDSGAPIRTRGEVDGVVLVMRDVTMRHQMEDELIKMQKLESLGVLAGGIAHDFNNVLTAIMGNISLAKLSTRPGDPILDRLNDAEKATFRAKSLTQHLLTFSKGGAPMKKVLPTAEFIGNTVKFALSGSRVRCELCLEPKLWSVEWDEVQIGQVLHNIVSNAEQSMPQGGVILVHAENLTLNESDPPAPGTQLKPGNYIEIVIRDEGVGIPREILTKIFDPYFTTKEKGAGLGLSIAHSIVKRHEGAIAVESEVGHGTTFRIRLPAMGRRLEVRNKKPLALERGEGRVLLMDDEEIIRHVGGKMLYNLGYEVDTAASGEQAIELFKQAARKGRPYDVVILDLTVPGGMGGREAVAGILAVDAQARVVVSSGYSSDPVLADFTRYGFRDVIAKPYRIEELGRVLCRLQGKCQD